MPAASSRFRFLLLVVSGVALVTGCASGPGRAPVEDRSPPPAATRQPAATTVTPPPPAPSAAPAPRPNAENAGRPGFYTVRPGDTLARVALDHGQNWRDLARWNGLDNPNVIEVGQVLRVAPPGADAAAVPQPVASGSRVESRPLDSRTPDTAPVSAPGAVPTLPSPPASATTSPPSPVREGDDDINWLWPATGPLLAGFDEGRNVKGLAIGGKMGDPVIAAADGRVVYAGSGLRGYGNLVIVKHNNTYLTAYAHNQALLVREDQVVRRGQKIAEMGSSDAERVQLHFEIRRLGKPVDPARLLPPR
jgi:lipoprotein NlpD